jgi:hypothetical protein
MAKRLGQWGLYLGGTLFATALCAATVCREEVTDSENDRVVWSRTRITLCFLSADPAGWHEEVKRPHVSFRERTVELHWFIVGARTKTGWLHGPENIKPPSGR